MKCIRLFIIIIFLVSCKTLPAINPPILSSVQKNLACPSPFLTEKYQLIHAIEIQTAGNVQGAIIGVTVADPSTRFISSAIMTAEGMVLLEAQSEGDKLIIHRALPPFDSGDFVKNLIDDIKLIFFPPEGRLQQKGNLSDGSTACRWQEKNGDFIDVIDSKTQGIEINKYSPYGSLKRYIKLKETGWNAYSSIGLQGSEMVNYTLIMTLIEAQKFEDKLPEKAKIKVKNNEKNRRR